MVAATLQAPPDNLFDPVVTPITATSLRITWREPGLPNGVIQYYQVVLTGEDEPIYTAEPGVFSYVHRSKHSLQEHHLFFSLSHLSWLAILIFT